jgi:hypothetical protein
MARFIECSTPSVEYRRGQTVENHAVNIDLCTRLRKSRLTWYPDNTGLAAIDFDGIDTKWAFRKEEDRNAEYTRIIALSNGDRNGSV